LQLLCHARMLGSVRGRRKRWRRQLACLVSAALMIVLLVFVDYFKEKRTPQIRNELHETVHVLLRESIDDLMPEAWKPIKSVHRSFMKAARNLTDWEFRARRWFAAHPCKGTSTDCEFWTALEVALWGMEDGTCLEMGGMDGVTLSTTLMFSRCLGWRRIVVEADPRWRDQRREFVPEVLGVQAAVCGAATKVLHFLHHRETTVQGIAEHMSDQFLAAWYPDILKARNDASGNDLSWSSMPWELFQYSKVSCVPMKWIFAEIGIKVIDFMVLDVEGAELDVLRSIDWKSTHISLLVVETTSFSRPASYFFEVVDFMLSEATGNCYELIFDKPLGRNAWFARKDFSRKVLPRGTRQLTNLEIREHESSRDMSYEQHIKSKRTLKPSSKK